ncbi:Yhc1p [Lachancea thermotolerans CBS 6340]|uniref:KLTH0H07106p n=1 Tax=Lachancea thermotolerans (strain ATCC 56472 / CBS 6340 / NRRL Y-8284) TaxID=559295 RepID=C5E2R5_LACTC|nr:KLTH0H07106p [Lachancea thermotolerans CBS 6340]CAR30326.1 KLTH0H07106p [Lachancea thermotolerans CBS 6340]
MPRFCDYCHSYLTHDTPSVRKSHLLGKNHVKLAADYYCNKARQTEKPIFEKSRSAKKNRKRARSPRGQEPERRWTLHCDTNRQKRQSHRAALAQQDLAPISVLEKLYRHSPAYAKVFVSECRLDTGQSVRLERLPQRANKRPQRTAAADPQKPTRDTLYKPDYSDAGKIPSAVLLPPPPSLARWPACPPLQLASDRAATATVQHVTRKLEARR